MVKNSSFFPKKKERKENSLQYIRGYMTYKHVYKYIIYCIIYTPCTHFIRFVYRGRRGRNRTEEKRFPHDSGGGPAGTSACGLRARRDGRG